MAGDINRDVATVLKGIMNQLVIIAGTDDSGNLNYQNIDSDGAALVRALLSVGIEVDLLANPGEDIGDVTARLATDYLKNGTTNLTPKFAIINAASGDNEIVAAVVGKKIRVLSYQAVLAAAATFRFEDGAAGTALTGIMSFGNNGGISVPFSPLGHFETTANTALSLEVTGDADGHITYVEV